MSFKFNWGGFPPEFNKEALEMLTQALNKGANKPPNLVGPIIAKELDLGSNPPQLDILEISELEEDRFRAMFRMKYEGDGFLVLQTQVQANPLRLTQSEIPTMPQIGVVAAAQPLVVPMLLRISGLKLHGIIVLAVSKQDGITLVFRSDPLVSVEVHSTFDSVPSVRRMLQREIEATLRTLFQDDLPVIVHEMSVNEIRRAREAKERERKEYIERQQQLIRMQHLQVVGSESASLPQQRLVGTAGSESDSVSLHHQQLMASQLHRRLMELSQSDTTALRNPITRSDYAHSTRSAEIPIQTRWPATGSASGRLHHRTSTMGGTSMSGDPQTLEQFLNDDWERMQHHQSSSETHEYLHSDSMDHQNSAGDQTNGVVVRASDNAVAARLASLMTMGQTLSPYTRRFEHTTMRSDVNPRLHPPPIFTLPNAGSALTPPLMSPAGLSGARQFSFSSAAAANTVLGAGASSGTPFSATTPPLLASGGRSPFPRNRTLRRKVHRIGGLGQNNSSNGEGEGSSSST
ncbi:ERMES complex subunit [Kickxella alabastrina]|uniref:ERMES complex subunit n=1 Tax=Kickxella alabastrina TaxID=61397 RepID=A0ACC1II00_9FUNG|nr:ERMES complex subunit [Kickxella alabastrina]